MGLATAGIGYEWQGRALGGMRQRGYAAHMETHLFTQAAAGLIARARQDRVCIMCVETDPALIEPDINFDHAARLF